MEEQRTKENSRRTCADTVPRDPESTRLSAGCAECLRQTSESGARKNSCNLIRAPSTLSVEISGPSRTRGSQRSTGPTGSRDTARRSLRMRESRDLACGGFVLTRA
ncbi:hypothetical protein BDW22DRAFT_1177367 [Trametopsis cervina]|nr:hypothetical protein BDW22DRAFT_1177367 [Trametopsis cervina]